MGKRGIRWGAGVVTLMILIGIISTRCYSPAGTAAAPDHTAVPIRIGVVAWPGYLPLYVAQDRGYFQAAGVPVELVHYTSQAECSREYLAGRLHGRANLTIEAIAEAAQGLDHKVVLVIDNSNGADGILGNAHITDLRQAAGKRVAYEFGTLEEYFLSYALEKNHLTLQQIVPVDLDPKAAAQALIAGTVDIAVTYEPYFSAAQATIGGHVLYSSADAPGIITDVLTFRTDVIAEHPEQIAAIVSAYFQALAFQRAQPDAAATIVGTALGEPGPAIAQQLRGILLRDAQDNETALRFSVGTQSLYGNMRRVGDFVQRHPAHTGTIIDTDRLIDRQFIRHYMATQHARDEQSE